MVESCLGVPMFLILAGEWSYFPCGYLTKSEGFVRYSCGSFLYIMLGNYLE